MTEELTLTVTDLERKAITFCKEKEITLPIANYLVEFAEEVTKELQEVNELREQHYADVGIVEKSSIAIKQLTEAKEIIRNYYRHYVPVRDDIVDEQADNARAEAFLYSEVEK